MEPQTAAQCEQIPPLFRIVQPAVCKSRNTYCRMGYPRISQFHIGTVPFLSFCEELHILLHHGHRIQLNLVSAVCLPPSGHHAGGGLYMLYLPRKPLVISIPGDAAGPIAAHFSQASVGIIKYHLVIAAIRWFFHHHKAVCTDTEPAVTESLCQCRESFLRNGFVSIIDNDEIITGSVHLGKFHCPILPLSTYDIVCRHTGLRSYYNADSHGKSRDFRRYFRLYFFLRFFPVQKQPNADNRYRLSACPALSFFS